jgi:hypothetical protein
MVLSVICQIKDQVTDLTDPKMNQCLRDLTGYENLDELMSKIYQEFLTANNLTEIAKETMNSLIEYQKSLQATDTSKFKKNAIMIKKWICVKWKQYKFFKVCVKWELTFVVGK